MARYHKRVHTDRDYPTLPNWAMRGDAARDQWLDTVMRDGTLSSVDKLIAHAYLRHWNSQAGWTFVSQYTIGQEYGLDRSNVRRSVNRLAEAGWLYLDRDKDRDRPHRWMHTALRLPAGKSAVTVTTKTPPSSDDPGVKSVVTVTKKRGQGDPLTVRKRTTTGVVSSAGATDTIAVALEPKEPAMTKAETIEARRLYLLKVRDHAYATATAGDDLRPRRASYNRDRSAQASFDAGGSDAELVQWLVDECGVDVVGLSRVAAILRAGDAHGPADGETVVDAVRAGDYGPLTADELDHYLAEAGPLTTSASAAQGVGSVPTIRPLTTFRPAPRRHE